MHKPTDDFSIELKFRTLGIELESYLTSEGRSNLKLKYDFRSDFIKPIFNYKFDSIFYTNEIRYKI